MKNRGKYLSQNFYRVLSHLLIILMMSLPFVQLVHNHGNVADERLSSYKKTTFHKNLGNCTVCDYLKSRQGDEFSLSFSSLSKIVLPTSIYKRPVIVVNLYTIALPGYTNKGPPSLVFG